MRFYLYCVRESSLQVVLYYVTLFVCGLAMLVFLSVLLREDHWSKYLLFSAKLGDHLIIFVSTRYTAMIYLFFSSYPDVTSRWQKAAS